jgi:hypothetical protein
VVNAAGAPVSPIHARSSARVGMVPPSARTASALPSRQQEERLPAVAPAIGFITVAVALSNAGRIGEGLILVMVALVLVRHWARRYVRTHLAEHYATHGDRMD